MQIEDSYLQHYGTKMHSGRYPWGSGGNAEQRGSSFRQQIADMRANGLSEKQIAQGMGMTIKEMRAKITTEKYQDRMWEASHANTLRTAGNSYRAIAAEMGVPEATVRNLLKFYAEDKADIVSTTANILESRFNDIDYLDVGAGTEHMLGISRNKLDSAIGLMKENGYDIQYVKVEQLSNPGQFTTLKLLVKEGATGSEIHNNLDKVGLVEAYSEDGGRNYFGLEPINNISSDRVYIKYGDQGGSNKDGVIELRKGVEDLSLGESRYAQVRIGVDGTSYMKGMAMYSDSIPTGYDIVYNTNKKTGTDKADVFKNIKSDPNNPFGSIVRQKHYIDADGNTQLSALNIMGISEGSYEEGSWGKWSKTLSSQFLAKQSSTLIKQQLDLDVALKKEEYDSIMALENSTVKKSLLESFADSCDSASVDLKAASLPRQATHVILPLETLSDTQVYAPNYKNGETVVLVRFPHGGIFEIPQLVVNNNSPEGKSILGQAKDAIGINAKVAEQLSGADFDGDTVLVIPQTKGTTINTMKPLTDLKNFDPKTSYKIPSDIVKSPDYIKMTDHQKQLEMGGISNLITDMTLQNATNSEIARAVKHSMVVIDAQKHDLNYKQSAEDNGIAALKEKYQGSAKAGASTLISKASSEARVSTRTAGQYVTDPVTGKTKKVYVDPTTGAKLYTEVDSTYSYVNKTTGKLVTKTKTISSTKMAEVTDAYELSSGTTKESLYADYANTLKSMANTSRLSALKEPGITYDATAAKIYKTEVESLKAKVKVAESNAPLERASQVIANSNLKSVKQATPNITTEEVKKAKTMLLTDARNKTGASKTKVTITDNEWTAIQSGAISNTTLTKIIKNTDTATIKALATPRTTVTVSASKEAKIRALLARGIPQGEIAAQLGVSATTVNDLA